jgi:hypothetical protein
MQLSVGATAILSLLTGSALTRSNANYNDTGDVYLALDVAAQRTVIHLHYHSRIHGARAQLLSKLGLSSSLRAS